MSMIWYPPLRGIESAFEISVDNPGYGELWIRVLEAAEYLGVEDWQVDLAGGQLGVWLGELTTRALSTTEEYDSRLAIELALPRRSRTGVPAWVTREVAAALLPAFSAAVLLAGAGTDRYERIYVDADDLPARPVCINCGEGSDWSSSDTTSAWCAENGHRPFGWAAGTSWQDALASHERRQRSESTGVAR